jgi:glycogen debranching enzyme
MRAFNPISYHNGSVWPHDNAVCIAGLMRYGFVEEAHRLVQAQLDAADISDGRLPELFAGFDRQRVGVPAAYPGSCSPQAWASAAPLLWLRALLRLDPWATKGQIWIDPLLPSSIRHLDVRGIPIGNELMHVIVDDGHVEITGNGAFELVQRTRSPLTTAFD